MQEGTQPSSRVDRVLSTAAIWRLAQIVLILAAAYLYFYVGSFAAVLQGQRITLEPHTANLLKLVVVGTLIGLFIGLALKDLSRGSIVFAVDAPTFILNLIGCGAFILVAFGLNVASMGNSPFLSGPIKDAVISSPLLPFVWLGLTLSTPVHSRPAVAVVAPQNDSVVTMAP